MESATCKSGGADPQEKMEGLRGGSRGDKSSWGWPPAMTCPAGRAQLSPDYSSGSTLATRSFSSFPGLNFTTARAGIGTAASGLFGLRPIFGRVFVT